MSTRIFPKSSGFSERTPAACDEAIQIPFAEPRQLTVTTTIALMTTQPNPVCTKYNFSNSIMILYSSYKCSYQSPPSPNPSHQGRGKRFLPLSPSLKGRKGAGEGQSEMLNCYKFSYSSRTMRWLPKP